jgi:glutathionyl-hydroquinone reductase
MRLKKEEIKEEIINKRVLMGIKSFKSQDLDKYKKLIYDSVIEGNAKEVELYRKKVIKILGALELVQDLLEDRYYVRGKSLVWDNPDFGSEDLEELVK